LSLALRNGAPMQNRLRSTTLVLLCLGTAACGQQADQAAGGVYARWLADTVTRECLQEKQSAPDAAHAEHVQRLCDCTRDKIIAARPGPTEPEPERRAKLKGALDSCVGELGATPAG
jgi:hypothetical protein